MVDTRGGNCRVTYDRTRNAVIDILKDSYMMLHHDICPTEKYKMLILTCMNTNILFVPYVVKAEVGQDFRLGSGRHISQL